MTMSCAAPLSAVSKKYLCCFREILNDMIAGMTDVSLTDSISHNFIVQMIPHHEAAIRMSQNLLQYTTCLPLERIAENIIAEQTKSIENMREILKRCGRMQNTKEQISHYQRCLEQIMETMFCQMRQAPSVNNINTAFIREMVPHHQGAIRMSENARCFSICPELEPILESIILSQRRGVREMERLLCG